jgi:hypothetical protein
MYWAWRLDLTNQRKAFQGSDGRLFDKSTTIRRSFLNFSFSDMAITSKIPRKPCNHYHSVPNIGERNPAPDFGTCAEANRRHRYEPFVEECHGRQTKTVLLRLA